MTEQEFIDKISKGEIYHNDIDDYVKSHNVQSFYESVYIEYLCDESWRLEDVLKYLELNYGCQECWAETEQETAKVSVAPTIESCLTDIYDKEEVLKFFQSVAEQKKPSIFACLIKYAIIWGMLHEKPTYKIVVATYGKIFSESGYNDALRKNIYDETYEKAIQGALRRKFGEPKQE